MMGWPLRIALIIIIFICLYLIYYLWHKELSEWVKKHPKRLREYQKRHLEALALVDESIVDIIKSTEIIMSGESQNTIDEVVYETIEKNYIIQRAFSEYRVIYFKEVGRHWIVERVKKIKSQWK